MRRDDFERATADALSGAGGAEHLVVTRSRPWPDTVVVMPAGDIDLLTGARLAAELSDAIAPPVTRLIVDLTEVDFLAARGATLLAAARSRAAEAGCEVVLVVTGRLVRRVLEVTGVLSAFPVYADVLDAFGHRNPS